jgi:hypothetical protein
MDSQTLELLNRKLEERVVSLVNFMADGGCKSYDHYKELCGHIRGLRAAQSESGDLVRKLKEYDNDD